MNQASKSLEETRRPMGTLACLVTGFEIVARHIELILLPLVLDLFLWLGPRLSVGPILQRLKSSMMAPWEGGAVPAEAATVVAWMNGVFDELGAAFNLFSFINPGPLSGVPVLMPARMESGRPFGVQPVIEIESQATAFGLIALVVLVGLGLSALYLRAISRRVLDEVASPLPGPLPALSIWRQLVKLGLLYVGAVIAISLLLSILVTIVALISGSAAGMLMMLIVSTMVFLSISAVVHLMFTIPGIVQLRRGIIPAMKESLLLSRGDFLNVVFLLGLIFIVSQGLNVVWMLPPLDSWTALIGLAGHAFVTTALTVAVFVFYHERLQFLEILKQIYTAQAEASRVSGER